MTRQHRSRDAVPKAGFQAAFAAIIEARTKEDARLKRKKKDILNRLGMAENEHRRRDMAWDSIINIAVDFRTYRGPARFKASSIYSRIERLVEELKRDRDSAEEAFEEYPDAMQGLLSAATTVLKGKPKPAHRGITRPVPPDCLWRLARVYCESTGKLPTASGGAFARFVHEFWTALGHGREFNTVVSDIKRWMRTLAA